MEKITYTEPCRDELLDRHDTYWRTQLDVADTPLLDGDEDPAAEAISFVLPYRAAFDAYTRHLARCASCTVSVLSQCPEGDELSERARRAVEALEASAERN
jgi:hypothetical protein